MLVIPEAFRKATLKREGDAGRDWLESLAERFMHLMQLWQLEPDGELVAHSLSVVVPVRQAATPMILKFAWPDEAAKYEALALKFWQGRGAVHCLSYHESYAALLLERLNCRRSLEMLAVDQALDIAADLYLRLCLPSPDCWPRQENKVETMLLKMQTHWASLGTPFPRQYLDKALTLALANIKPEIPVLLNYDLHQGNVLGSSREPWLVIDPKVLLADKEYGVAQLFWYHLDIQDRPLILGRLDRFIERSGLEPHKTYAWTFIRCLDYWLWGLSVGLTEDPKRCEVLAHELAKRL